MKKSLLETGPPEIAPNPDMKCGCTESKYVTCIYASVIFLHSALPLYTSEYFIQMHKKVKRDYSEEHDERDNDTSKLDKCGFSTRAIHFGNNPNKRSYGAIVPAIDMTTTFKYKSPEAPGEYEYGRTSNPTRDMLEVCLASLERGKHCVTFSSGMGAATAILSLLYCNDHMICCNDIYGGTTRLLKNTVSNNGIDVTFVDFTYMDNISKAIKPNTKMLWFESPTNPLMTIFDIKAIAKLAHDRGNIIVVLDNTFLTAYFQQPLNLGVDISMYSITKYLNGHADIIMGCAVLNDSALALRLRILQSSTGIIPSPHDCFMVNRSIKTLALRMERHQLNALALAHFLEKHRRVLKVFHPGLKSHKNHELFKQQATGHSGVFSFRHMGGIHESQVILASVKIFILAESLGGYESLIGFPTTMSHGSLDQVTKEHLGINHSLIRLSCGLEDPEDLIADMDCALKLAFPVSQWL